MSLDLKRGQLFKPSDCFHRGSHYYRRDDKIELQQLLDEAGKPSEFGVVPKYVHAYCDQLTLGSTSIKDGTASAIVRHQRLRTLFIYARSISLGSAVNLLLFQDVKDLTVRFVFDECPNATHVGLTSGKARAALNLEAELPSADSTQPDSQLSKRNRCISVSQDQVATRLQIVGREMNFRNDDGRVILMRNIANLELDGNLCNGSLLASEKNPLFEFCTYTYDRVSVSLTSYERNQNQKVEDEKACSRMRFVAALTRNSVVCAELCADANMLLERIDRPRRTAALLSSEWTGLRLDVPQMIASEDLAVVQADFQEIALWETERKDILKGIEDRKALNQVIEAINTQTSDDFAAIEASLAQLESHIVTTQETVLTAISYAVDDYRDLDALLGDFNQATADITVKNDAMTLANDEVKRQQYALIRGIEAYEEDQEKKFVFSCLAAAAEIAVSVGAIVATAGAAAPAGAAAAADGVGKVAGAAAKLAKIKDSLRKVTDLVIKLGAKFLSDKKNLDRKEDGATSFGTKAAEMVKKAAALVLETTGSGAALLPADATAPLDYLGILADWEEFKIDIDELFMNIADALQGDKVDGMSEFRTALRKLCVRGETLLEARARAQTAAIVFNRAFGEAVKREARKAEIERMAKSLKAVPFKISPVQAITDLTVRYESATAGLRALCEDKLAHLRRVALVSIYSYMADIMYEQCLSSFPAQVDLSSSMTNIAWAEVQRELLQVISAQQKSRSAPQATPTLIISTERNEDRNFNPQWRDELRDTGRLVCHVPENTLETKPFYRMRADDIKLNLHGLKFRAGQTLSAVSYRVVQGPVFDDEAKNGTKLQYIIATTDEFHFTDFLNLTTWSTSTAGCRANTVEANKYQLPTLLSSITFQFSEEATQALNFDAVTRIEVSCTATGNSK